MDAHQFDDVARSLIDTRSRRGALRLLAGAVLGGLVPLARSGAAEARQCRTDRGCEPCQRCRNGRCSGGCANGERCVDGACVEAGERCTTAEDCGACRRCLEGRCVAVPELDGKKCGGCFRCRNGRCAAPSAELCDDDEICRVETGICCPKCVSGRCCPIGERCIDPGPFSANFCCNEELNEPCGHNGDGTFGQCCSKANEKCCDGECVPMDQPCCPAGRTVCGGTCVDTKTDASNCGACGVRCRSGCQRCENGTCVTTGPCCQPGEIDCGTRCLNPRGTDPFNCGGCGVKCGSCEHCDYGTCRRLCAPGWDCCGSASCCAQPGIRLAEGEPRRVPRQGTGRAAG